MSEIKIESNQAWTNVNKEHYDTMTDDLFQISWIQEMHADIKKFFTANLPWLGISENARYANGTGIRVLDFAGGNGVLSLALEPYAAELRGIDISSAMVQLYNDAAAKNGLGPQRMRAVEADILSADPSAAVAAAGPEFSGFNLAVISMALHHIADAEGAIRALADRVVPGGAVLVIDWLEHPQSHHQHRADEHPLTSKARHTIAHNGFSEQKMLDLFSKAGLVDGEVRLNPRATEVPTDLGGTLQLFYALARKPLQ